MCGIAGVLRFDGQPLDADALARMTHALAHRGPDGGGVEHLGPCGLGHRRLSIIDLSEGGHQPMPTPDGRYWLTYNGEVYNYLELRRELEAQGVTFRSDSDSEVILQAYRAWGLAAFERFNGMWALGIWDTAERTLVLSRDRFGVKPLYVHQDGARVLFASEVKAILIADPSLRRLDEAALADYLIRPVVGYGRPTYFAGVERLDPGSVRVIRADGSMRDHRYWTFLPPPEPADVSPREAAERVEHLLSDAVRLRFRSDVPVGTCLSGGLDSSSIVALAAKKLGKAPACFSAIYDVPGYEEEEFVDAMIEELHLTSHKVSPDASDLPEVMETAAYYQEEPTGAPGIYSQYHVMRTAAPHVKVLLDGQGGDEVFGGYFPYFVPYMDSLFARARKGDVAAVAEALAAGPAIKDLTGANPMTRWVKDGGKLAKNWLIRTARARVEGVPVLHDVGRWVRRGVERAAPERARSAPASEILGARLTAPERLASPLRPTGDVFTDTLWDQLIRSSIPGLLHYEDRNSMAFSIEARVPFLDYRLVEYAFTLPTREKIHGARTKVVLREAMKGILPERVRERRDKKGYPTPFALWLKSARHTEWARDLLVSKRVADRGFVDTQYAARLWEQHTSGTADHSWRLWQLTAFELFCRRFADGPLVPETRLLGRSGPPGPVRAWDDRKAVAS